MSNEPIIKVENLGKAYHIYDRPEDRLKQSLSFGRRKYFREFWALQDVSFEVAKGETVGIIGVNGSGKSTMLQMIAGTLSPTTGTARTSGRVAALLELGSGFNPDFTGRENVYLNGAILGLDRGYVDSRMADILAFADIGQFIDQPVKTYSTGMGTRLAFSVSINVEPDVLIVDEALAVGDMGFQMKCMERLDQLTKSGITLLFVSHDILAVKAFCSRAIYLEAGKVKAQGAASDMVELYLMDLRDAQRRNMGSSAAAVRPKVAVGRPGSVAFGTAQGRVVSARFEPSETVQWACSTGEMITIAADLEYDESVKNPAVSLVLHDHRMLDLSGRYFHVQGKRGDDGLYRASVRFTMPVNLNNLVVYFTVRLEDRATDDIFFPIDKQAGALQLHVTRPTDRHFLGLYESPIEFEQRDA
jgi:lipopolysaccharide transport system ATP-binding protein